MGYLNSKGPWLFQGEDINDDLQEGPRTYQRCIFYTARCAVIRLWRQRMVAVKTPPPGWVAFYVQCLSQAVEVLLLRAVLSVVLVFSPLVLGRRFWPVMHRVKYIGGEQSYSWLDKPKYICLEEVSVLPENVKIIMKLTDWAVWKGLSCQRPVQHQ